MTKAQTRLRESSPSGKQKIRFHLVREGEPVPEFAPLRIANPRRRKYAAPALLTEAEAHCPLCEVAITRFDAGVFHATGRCGPCHEALEGE